MNIKILDTIKGYRKMLKKASSEKEDYLRNELLKDFIPIFKRIGMPIDQLLNSLLPITESEETYLNYLNLLEQEDIEAKCLSVLKKSMLEFEKSGIPLPKHLILGIYLGNPHALAHSEGYTGFGGIPGYIQMVIAPTLKNLQKLPAAVCHELHHNSMFLLKPFDFTAVTLKEYILYEGLAENFAEEMCGEDMIGPWVTNISKENLELSKALIKPKLNLQGFQAVAPYIFGGQSVSDPKGNSTIMPASGGYAAGYHIVKAYRKQTGQSTLEAMVKSPDEIIDESRYF
ncbi:DUF2268 domain-containing putative Zn-dependent protease [Wukongibacter baidiensis]|uniref:DUF2268 domain-containing protein n=1 Tax=Wukongibacter baidiensis TaxID=1723361 RepID=UPI003D7F580B